MQSGSSRIGGGIRALATTGALLLLLLCTPALPAQDSVAALKEKILDIQNAGQLGFRNFVLCSKVITYGQYVANPDNKVKAGSKIYFYYEPDNIFTERSNGTYHIAFTQDMIVRNDSGDTLLRAPNALKFDYEGRTPVLDVYGVNTLTLGDLPPGHYQFVAVLHDTLKRADAQKVYQFEIVP
ncbi:hypothetical protein [Salinispira pacifica]